MPLPPHTHTPLKIGGVLSGDTLDSTRGEALRSVTLPPAIAGLLGELRSWLQKDCEPPVYVSDRRLVKSVALLKLAA